MKYFWKKLLLSVLTKALILTAIIIFFPFLRWFQIFVVLGLTKTVVITSIAFLTSLTYSYGIQFWLMKRWADYFGEDIGLIAFAVYVMKYNLSTMIPDEERKSSIENAKRVFYK